MNAPVVPLPILSGQHPVMLVFDKEDPAQRRDAARAFIGQLSAVIAVPALVLLAMLALGRAMRTQRLDIRPAQDARHVLRQSSRVVRS